MTEDIRWHQRLENFTRALELLREVQQRGADSLSQLEKEGAIQRFEMTFELGWKTLKDYLQASGVSIDPITPRNVIKEAFSARIIEDGQVWIDMMFSRNNLSHTYSGEMLTKALQTIEARYFAALVQLHVYLKAKQEP